MIRCFLCIETPEDLKEKVLEVQKEFKEFNIKFVEKENLHMTLAFLVKGDKRGVSEYDVEGIKKIMNNLDFKKFEILIKGLIPIPSKNYIRVLCFKIIKGKEEIKDIQYYFKKELKKLSITPRINPAHLTIGRVRTLENKDKLLKKVNKFEEKEIGGFICNKITLMQSKLTPKGPIYNEIFSKSVN